MSDPQINELTLSDAISRAGGAAAVASACNKTPRAIYKWLANGTLPRTDFTGETQYAETMAELSDSSDEPFTADELRSSLRRQKAAA